MDDNKILGNQVYAQRGQINQLLEEALEEHSVIAVTGGSGIGKTSSISSFVSKTREYVVWVQFGSTSLYTEKFRRSFTKALGNWDRVLAAQMGQIGFPETISDTSRFLTLLHEAVARAGKVIFVFDDFHLLKDGPVKYLIVNIVNSCSSNISTIIISRNDVELGDKTTVRVRRLDESHLQFTHEDIRIYYTALGIVMDQGMLDRIWGLTGGWTAAVYLLGRHLCKGEPLIKDSLDNAVLFLHEMFQKEYHDQLNTSLNHSLILLGLLNSFTMEMAVELTALTVEDLYQLVRQNTFIQYHTDTHSYSFHILYQQFLRNKQLEVPTKVRYTFLRKAAEYCEKQGAIIESLEYYLGCHKYDHMLMVLKKINIVTLAADLANLIADLLAKVPEEYRHRHPEHQLFLIFTRYFAGQSDTALRMRRDLQKELEGKDTPESKRILGELYLSKAFSAWNDGMGTDYIRYMEAAYQRLPEGSSFLSGDPLPAPGGTILRFVKMEPGDLLVMKDAALAAIPYNRSILHTNGMYGYLAASEAHMFRMEFSMARAYAGSAIQEAADMQSWGFICENCYNLMRISMIDGSLSDVLYYRKQIRIYAKYLPQQQAYKITATADFRLYMFLLMHDRLQNWEQVAPTADVHHIRSAQAGRDLYIHALYMFNVTKQYYPAITFIDQALPICLQHGMWFTKLKLIILKAAIFAVLEMPGVACKYFVEAYNMSYGNKVILPFAEHGRKTIHIIESIDYLLPESGIPSEWISEVQSGAKLFEQQRRQMSLEYRRLNPQATERKLELLSVREYEALKLLCQGYSDESAAEHMSIAPETFKQHYYNAFRKIGAANKTEAMHIAITEGILGTTH